MDLLRKVKPLLLILFISLAIFVLNLMSLVSAEEGLLVSSYQIITPDSTSDSVAYSQLITIMSSEGVTIYISGTDLYDSTSSSARCPTINHLTITNIAYYAQIGDYSTKQDPRADSDGYISLPFGMDFETSKELLIDHSLISSVGNAIITFRFNIPTPCRGNFDTGQVLLWTKNQFGDVTQTILTTQLKITNTPEVFKCGTTSYFSASGEPLINRINNHLFEGEKIQWNVLVTDLSGIDYMDSVHITTGSSPVPGNKIVASCMEYEESDIDIRSCNAKIKEKNIIQLDPQIMNYYNCTLTIDKPESMYGLFWVTVEAQDLGDLKNIMNQNELWFFNPVIACYSNLECDDNNPLTEDFCTNAGKVESMCENNKITCFSNSDCGQDTKIGDNFCISNNVCKNVSSFNCINPGTFKSYCSSSVNTQIITSCGNDYCEDFSTYLCGGTNWCDGADLNKDRRVNLIDWIRLRKNFGKKCSVKNRWCNNSDINRDGIVNIKDSLKLLSNYGRNDCSQGAVYSSTTCYKKGCSAGACFNDVFKNETMVQKCEFRCSGSKCIL